MRKDTCPDPAALRRDQGGSGVRLTRMEAVHVSNFVPPRMVGLVLLCILAALAPVRQLQAQDTGDKAVWAQDLDLQNLDVQSIRRDYGLWDLLSQSVVRKESGDVKAEVAYVNPITYVLLLDQRSKEALGVTATKEKLREVFDRHRLFYIVLKTEKDPGLIEPGHWKVSATTVRNKEVGPEKIDSSEPELTYGYTGNFYETVIFAYFKKGSTPGNDINVLQGSSLVLEQKTLKLRDEFLWSDRKPEEQQAGYLLYHRILKIVLPVLFALLIVAIVLTRPTKGWRSSGL